MVKSGALIEMMVALLLCSFDLNKFAANFILCYIFLPGLPQDLYLIFKG
jgi:hypothetical protein